jgi:hypothetical protein
VKIVVASGQERQGEVETVILKMGSVSVKPMQIVGVVILAEMAPTTYRNTMSLDVQVVTVRLVDP